MGHCDLKSNSFVNRSSLGRRQRRRDNRAMQRFNIDAEKLAHMTKPQLTKPTKVVDVPADNPEGTMDRFSAGLRRVVSAPKTHPARPKPNHGGKRRRGTGPG